jgi:hypothetical protein
VTVLSAPGNLRATRVRLAIRLAMRLTESFAEEHTCSLVPPIRPHNVQSREDGLEN